MALGLTLSPSRGFGTRRVLDLASDADRLGFETVWFAESDQADAIGLMHAAAISTRQAAVASGVIPIQTRPPALVAMGCANLTHIAPSRVRLGIGHSSANVVGRWSGREFVRENAIEQVAEYIGALRACLTGERVEFDGRWNQIDGFRLRIPPATQVEIVVAALGDHMAVAAANMADGVLMSYVGPERLEKIVPEMRSAAANEGRDFRLCVVLHVAVTDDPAAVVDAYRRVLVAYSTVDAYASVFGEAGFGEQVAEVRRFWQQDDRKAALAAVDDGMVQALTAFGPIEAVAERVRDLLFAGADEVAIGLVEGEGTSGSERVLEALADAV